MKRFFNRIARFFWSWGFLKFVLFAITLVVLLYVEEDWRGARAWAVTKAKWEARGVSFDFGTYLPPPVPAEKNLAALPLFKMEPGTDPQERGYLIPLALRHAYSTLSNADTDAHPLSLGDWQHGKSPDMNKVRQAVAAQFGATLLGRTPQSDLAAQFATLHPFLAELREAAASRPFCRFEQSYQFDVPSENDLSLVTAQIGLSKCLAADAVIALDSGKPEQALADIRLNNQLARGLMDQPILVSGLVAVGMNAIDLGAVYDGLATHAWNDAQLAQIERDLGQLDFLSDYHRLMRGEAVGILIPAIDRIKMNWAVWLPNSDGASYKDNFPSVWANGWIDLWKVRSVDLDLTASDWIDSKSRLVLPKAMATYQAESERALESPTIYLPWNWLFRMGVTGPVFKALRQFSQAQVWVDEARVACALERYRLAQGKYPSTLEALDGDLPHDVMSGEPYRYRVNADGTYLLYSVGWNERDDGGIGVDEPGTTHRDYTQGDWVWPIPR